MTFKGHSRSSKMSRFDRAHMTSYFLLPFRSNYGPILYRLPHIARYLSKIAKFIYSTSIQRRRMRWPRRNFAKMFSLLTRKLDDRATQSHRLERVVPTHVPAGVRSRGVVADMFRPSVCGAVVHSHSLRNVATCSHWQGCPLFHRLSITFHDQKLRKHIKSDGADGICGCTKEPSFDYFR